MDGRVPEIRHCFQVSCNCRFLQLQAIAFIRQVWYVSGTGAGMPYVRRSRKPEDEEPAEGRTGEAAAPPRPVRTSPLVEAPIYLLVFFTPLAIGTVHLWSVTIMLAVALFAYSAMVMKRTRRRRSILLFPMGVALLAVCGLTLLQIIPLPPFFVRVLNPGAADLYDHVLAGTGLWGEGNWRALSLAPPATAVELVKFLAYALAFLVVVNYFNDRHRARRCEPVRSCRAPRASENSAHPPPNRRHEVMSGGTRSFGRGENAAIPHAHSPGC